MSSRKSFIKKPLSYDDAFITSIVAYGDKDCIVRMFTRSRGRMTAFFARGLVVRKGMGAAQAPILARVGFIDSTNGLLRLSFCDSDPEVMRLFSCLKAFGYGAYLAELIEQFLPEADAAPEIFELILEAFEGLDAYGAHPGLLRAFELRLLALSGYLPEMPKEGEQEQILAFDPVGCRFLDELTKGSLPFSYAALKLAQIMLIAKVGAVNYEEETELLMIGRIFQSRLKLMGLASLKTVTFLKQIQRT